MPDKKQDTGSVNEVTAISIASAVAASVTVNSGPNMTRGGMLISTTLAATLNGPVVGEAAQMYGIADDSLTATEIKEFLEINGPLAPTPGTPLERSTRGARIRTLGVLFPGSHGSAVGERANFHKNERISLKWSEEGGGWQWWSYNLGASLSTGSQELKFAAQHYVRWNKSG